MLTTVLIFTPVYVTTFWTLVLLLTPKKGNAPKKFLGYFMILAFILYFSHAIFFLRNVKLYLWLDSIQVFSSLAIFPMFYIYIRLLTSDPKFSIRKHLFYFIPSMVIGLLSLLGYIWMDPTQRHFYLNAMLHGSSISSNETVFQYQNAISIVKKVTFIIQTTIFALLSYHAIRTHHREVLNFYSNTDGKLIKWLHWFNIILISALIISAFLEIIGRAKFASDETILPVPAIIFSTILFAIGFLGNTQEAVLIHTNQKSHYKHIKPLKETTPDDFKSKLSSCMADIRTFSNSQLNAIDLEACLHLNYQQITQLINTEIGMTFNDYVNLHRINYAKSLLEDHKYTENELDTISKMAGFPTVNSFKMTFQKIEHISPERYLMQYA